MEGESMPPIIREIGQDLYPRYAEIDSSYGARSVLRVVPRDRGLGGFEFIEEKVAQPCTKSMGSPEDSPLCWPPKQESGAFTVFLALDGDLAVGGAVVIINPTAAILFERRETLAGLWDIRVRPEYRRTGLGSQLLLHAAAWAKKNGCNQLRIESQNVNVAACRFYAKHCILGGVERFGYAACPDVAHEAMLLWYRDL
jgi:ribosomal protein S18 acetylase RimI-like enzyme